MSSSLFLNTSTTFTRPHRHISRSKARVQLAGREEGGMGVGGRDAMGTEEEGTEG